MARGVNRGGIWGCRFRSPNKRRPVLVLSRQDVIPLLHTVMVAPVTSAQRGAPSEVRVGVEEGLERDSAVNLDHVQTVEKARLERLLGGLSTEKMRAVCSALAIATGCNE